MTTSFKNLSFWGMIFATLLFTTLSVLLGWITGVILIGNSLKLKIATVIIIPIWGWATPFILTTFTLIILPHATREQDFTTAYRRTRNLTYVAIGIGFVLSLFWQAHLHSLS